MENSNDINPPESPFAIIKKDSGTAYELIPNSSKTVQPVALLRLSVFTPVSPKEKGKREFLIDASEELSSLEVARQEGYTNIKIQGAKLGMSTDFKTWIGIISAFSKYGYSSEKITLPFSEFARMCGLKPTDINGRARTRLSDSLFNLSSVTLAFRSKDGKRSLVTHLVQRAVLDMDADLVEIVGDPSLWELYRYDHKVLLGLKALSELSRKEAAQSLYVYFESMPPSTLFVSMKRLRERLAMESQVKDQNATIRRAMTDLKKIGYIDYTETKKGEGDHVHHPYPLSKAWARFFIKAVTFITHCKKGGYFHKRHSLSGHFHKLQQNWRYTPVFKSELCTDCDAFL